jgi:predicted nucleic acid-binding protein
VAIATVSITGRRGATAPDVTVVDASVLVAALHPSDTGHAACIRWLRSAAGAARPASAPSIVLAEVASAVARATSDADLALRVVHALRLGWLELVPVTEQLATRAAEIAALHGVRGCDAVYLALAESRGDALVTLDREQLDRGTAVVHTSRPE